MLLSLLIGAWHLIHAQPPPVLLDPAKAKDTTYSGIFEETEFIPLETTRQSIFGVIKQLVVTDRYFIILDTDTDAILFFNKQGKFITKYKNRLSRYRITYIQQDLLHNALLVFSQNRNYNITAAKLQKYLAKEASQNLSTLAMATRFYLDDPYVHHTESLSTPAYLLTNPVFLGNGQFAFSFIWSDQKNPDIQDYELQVVKDDSLIQKHFPYHLKTDSAFYGSTARQCSFFPTLNDSVVFMSRPFQPFIYRLTPRTVTEAYQIAPSQASANKTPPEGFSFASFGQISIGSVTIRSGRSQNRQGGLSLNNANTVTNFISQKRFIFFNVQQSTGSYNNYIFDTRETRLYDRSKLKADSNNYIFPLRTPILAFDETNIYQSFSARALFNLKKGAGKDTPHYEKSLARFYDTGKPENNPVILRLKPKQD